MFVSLLKKALMGAPVYPIASSRSLSHGSYLKYKSNRNLFWKTNVFHHKRKIFLSIEQNEYDISSWKYLNRYLCTNHENSDRYVDSSDDDKSYRDSLKYAVQETFKTESGLSDQEWTDVMDKLNLLFGRVTTTFDGIVMKFCLRYNNFSLADSYLEYLKTLNREPNILGISLYLQMCSVNLHKCGEAKILSLYQLLASKVKAFDATLSEHVIVALSRTSKWKEGFKHMPVIKMLDEQVNSKVYNALVQAAFRNQEFDTGWQLVDIMHKEERDYFDETFIEWIDRSKESEDKRRMGDGLLEKLGLYEIYPKIPVAEEIKSFYEDNFKWTGRYVKMDNSGKCPACNEELQTSKVDQRSFIDMKEEYISRVLLGSDIYKKTSPGEWSRFQKFVEKQGPFSVVVDGLNVAYSLGAKPANMRMKRLKLVVKMLKSWDRRSKIMIIGRNHMEGWSSRDLEEIQNQATVYMLDNLTKDDGFFIYAALESGLGTKFVTSDLLRNHIYALGDLSLRETFKQWQRKHQIFGIQSEFGYQLLPPPTHKTAAQKDEDSWHIPYNDGSIRECYEKPSTWLCLQSDKRRHKLRNSENISQHIPFKNLKLQNDFLETKSHRAQSENIEYGRLSLYSEVKKIDSTADNSYAYSKSTSQTRNKMKEDMKRIKNQGKPSSRNATSKYKDSSSKSQKKVEKVHLKGIFND